jgi:hypothetical protein
MTMDKKRLPRGVELEKRRYIGFTRTPVIDESKVLINSNAEPKSRWYVPEHQPPIEQLGRNR